jgi:2-polyprenyl-3-methyl-5-hydroxy-6-metoxy-1,4-benzoquinol methylase
MISQTILREQFGAAELDVGPCILCGERHFDLHLRVSKPTGAPLIPPFDVLRCRRCGLCHMHPFPTPDLVREIYVKQHVFSRSISNPYQRNVFFSLLEPLYRNFGDDCRFIVRQCLLYASHTNDLKVLDVGCGLGSLLLMFKRLAPGAVLRGIDIDPGARENAPADIRDNIEIGDLLETPMAGELDIVTLRFVVEHLLDPLAYVKRAASLLRPGGVLMLSTPDNDSARAKLQGSTWPLLNHPDLPIGHVTWFNRASLAYLSQAAGLRILSVRNRGEVIWHLHSRYQKLLRQLLGTEPTRGRFIRHYPLRILWASLIDGLLSERIGCGDCLYAVMQKQ